MLPEKLLGRLVLITGLVAGISACISSDKDDDCESCVADEQEESVVYRGVFVDSPVSGLNYQTATQSGFTNANGEFQYQLEETVSFAIGDIKLGSAIGQAYITPLNLDIGASSADHPSVLNRLRLLQSLDDDGDVDNGINISEQTREDATGLSVNFEQVGDSFHLDAGVQTLLLGGFSPQLVSASSALIHFKALQQSLNLSPNWQQLTNGYAVITKLNPADAVLVELSDRFVASNLTAGTQMGITRASHITSGNGYQVGNVDFNRVEQTDLFRLLVNPAATPAANVQANELAAAMSTLSGVSASASTSVDISNINVPINGLIVNGTQIADSGTEGDLKLNLQAAGFVVTDIAGGGLTINVTSGADIVINTGGMTGSFTTVGTNTGGTAFMQSSLNNTITTTGGTLTIDTDVNVALASSQTVGDNVWGTFEDDSFTRQAGQNAFAADDSDTYNATETLKVYDSLGIVHELMLFFVKEPLDTQDLSTGGQPNTWSMYAQIDGNDVGGTNPNVPTLLRAILRFNEDGTLAQTEPTNIIISNWTPNVVGDINASQLPLGPDPSDPVVNDPATTSHFKIDLLIDLLP